MSRFSGIERGVAAFTSPCPWCGELIFPGERIEARYIRSNEGQGRFAGRHPRRDWALHARCARRLDARRADEQPERTGMQSPGGTRG